MSTADFDARSNELPKEALILVGGRGTRLASVVSDLPKPMAPVNGRPFLEFIIDELASSGITRVILCVGYQAQKVISHFESREQPIELLFSREETPLGTGGAVLQALASSLVKAERFLVINGDSLVQIRPDKLDACARSHDADAVLSLVTVPDSSRYGTVEVEGERIVRYLEKAPEQREGLINAGVYLFARRALRNLPVKPCSMEQEILPELTRRGKAFGVTVNSPFLDIGIPEAYSSAPDFIAAFRSAKGRG